MANTTLKTRIILNNKTSEEWASSTYNSFVPLKGEVCIYSDLRKIKIGDGITTVANLTFANLTPEEVQSLISAASHSHSNKSILDATTASFTTALLNKLNGIADGAEVNQNAFSKITVGSTTVEADSKTDTLTLVAGSNVTITPDATNDKITIEAKDTTYGAAGDSLGLVKTGGDVTISSGVITVNDDSHNHVISNVDGLQSALDGKSPTSHTHSSYVNQNAFSNVVVGSTTITADSATDTLTLTAGSNVTLTPDATNDSVTIAAKDTVYTHPTSSGNKHIPSGGSSGQILRWSADGTAAWGADNNTTYSAGTGISLSGTTFSNSGVRSISTGSANGTISVNTNGTSADVAVKGLGSAAYTNSSAYAASGHTHNYAGSSSAGGAANSVANAITIKLNGGATEDTNLFTFNGSSTKSINITPSAIGAATSSHGTHVSYSTDAPKENGTAAVGSSEAVARADHVHPLQINVSGNAGTATKLASEVTINNTSFDGSANITTANWGSSRSIKIGDESKSINGSTNVTWTPTEVGYRHEWQATVTCGIWSRLLKCNAVNYHSKFLINIASYSNGLLLYNETYIVTNSNSTGKIIKVSGSGLPNGSIRVRAITNSSNMYFEVYDKTGSYTSGSTTHPVYCKLIPISCGTITRYTSFTTGETVPSGYNTALLSISTEQFQADTIKGSLSGNASTATKLETARSINGTSFNGSADITTTNWGTARDITIGSTTKSIDGSGNISWSLSEIGAASSSHTHDYIPTSASCNKNWNWSGLGGQPTWVWGGENGTDMYVYNPANFSVNYANSAGSATYDSAGRVIGSSYLPLSGGTVNGILNVTGGFNVNNTGSNEVQINLYNDLVAGRYVASSSGKLGLYNKTIENWIYYTEANVNRITIPAKMSAQGIYDSTTSGSANVVSSSSGYAIKRSTSASKYKLDIKDIEEDESYSYNILKLNPKQWFDRGEVERYSDYLSALATGSVDENENYNDYEPNGIDSYYGLIAEDIVEAGLDKFCTYGKEKEDGTKELEGIYYDRLPILYIPILRDLVTCMQKILPSIKESIKDEELLTEVNAIQNRFNQFDESTIVNKEYHVDTTQ